MKKVILCVKSYVFLLKILHKKSISSSDLKTLESKYGVKQDNLNSLKESLEWIGGNRPDGR